MAALGRSRANLKRYRAAVLKAACEGRLVPIEAELARKEGRGFESGDELVARIYAEARDRGTGARSSASRSGMCLARMKSVRPRLKPPVCQPICLRDGRYVLSAGC